MASRRKKLARDFHTCRICGYAHIFWPPKDSRQTNKPLDSAQPMYLDVDDPAPDAEGYDSYGYRHRGRRVAAHEQRQADSRNVVVREGPGRVLRIMKVYPVHQCEPAAGSAERGARGGECGTRSAEPAPEPTGKERACPD